MGIGDFITGKKDKGIKNPKMSKIKILKSVAGRYLLSYNIGEEVMHEAKQAAEMVENKDAKFVK